MLTLTLLFVFGAVLLIAGAELLVRGASRLALGWGISPLVVGLTVVAFGTSSPELAVTVSSAYSGEANVALGNVVGSNICNVLLILGLSAAIAPLRVDRQLVRLDVPLMIGASVLTVLLSLDGRVGTLDGVLLVSGMIAYTAFLIHLSRRDPDAVKTPDSGSPAPSPGSAGKNLLWIVAGLGMLVLGSQWLVDAAVRVANSLGVSELVIGLTVVAVGTSLPEIATSVLASLRGQRDIAVGNAVGSNLFNLLLVLGLGSILAPEGIPVPAGALSFDLPVMLAVAVATLPIAFTGYCIGRWEGALFLGYYGAYTAYLVLDASGHDAISQFQAAMVWFVLPLTAVTLAVLSYRFFAQQRQRAAQEAVGE